MAADSVSVLPNVIVLPSAIVATRHVTSLSVGKTVRRSTGFFRFLWNLLVWLWALITFQAKSDHYVIMNITDGRVIMLGSMPEKRALDLVSALAQAIYNASDNQGVTINMTDRSVRVGHLDASHAKYRIGTIERDMHVHETEA